MVKATIVDAMIVDRMTKEYVHPLSSQDLRSTIVTGLSLRGYSIVGNRKRASDIKALPPPDGSR